METIEIIILAIILIWFVKKYEDLKFTVTVLSEDHDYLKHRMDCVTDRMHKEDIEKMNLEQAKTDK